MSGFEVLADIVCREKASCIVGGIRCQGRQKVNIPNTLTFDNVFQHDSGIDVTEIFKHNLLL